MNVAPIIAYLQQPTTISGIGTLLGGGVAAVTQRLTHDPAAALTLFAAVKSAVSILIPDNSAAQQDAVTFSKEVLSAALHKSLAPSLETLAFDGLKLFQDVRQSTVTTATVSTTSSTPAASA